MITITLECKDQELAAFILAIHAVYSEDFEYITGLLTRELPDAIKYLRDKLNDNMDDDCTIFGYEVNDEYLIDFISNKKLYYPGGVSQRSIQKDLE